MSSIPDLPGTVIPKNSEPGSLAQKSCCHTMQSGSRSVRSFSFCLTLHCLAFRHLRFQAASLSASVLSTSIPLRTKSTSADALNRSAKLLLYISYWVCEKSDGIRVLFVVLTTPHETSTNTHCESVSFVSRAQELIKSRSNRTTLTAIVRDVFSPLREPS